MIDYEKDYWNKRLPVECKVPERVERAIRRIYSSYPQDCLPQGICDPLYIMNVICFELGIGDGKGKFNLP